MWGPDMMTKEWKTVKVQYVMLLPTLAWDINLSNKGKHDTIAACRQGKVDQVYIKSKCGHNNVFDMVKCRGKIICWPYCILDIYLVLLFKALKIGWKIKIIPSKYVKFRNFCPF